MKHLLLNAVMAALGYGSAASLQDAQASLARGDWKAAADAALTLQSADGYALAAKATTLGASLSPEAQQADMLESAQGYAKKAIDLDAGNADANFELARADGRLAQFRGVLQSLSLAGEVKASLDKTLKINPNYAGAYVALGLWNAELASKGFIATAATGASANNVVPNFQKAIALEPTVPAHRLEYANAMLKLSTRAHDYQAFAVAQLQKALSFKPRDFWDKHDQDSAKQLLTTLK